MNWERKVGLTVLVTDTKAQSAMSRKLTVQTGSSKTGSPYIDEEQGVKVLGVKVDPISAERLMAAIQQMIINDEHLIVSNVNVHALNIAYRSPWFANFLNESAIVFCDGFGVKWAVRLLGAHVPERITYADWMWQLTEFVEPLGFTLYFLGSAPSVAEEAAVRLRERYPGLQIVGTDHGFFDKTPGSADNERIINSINAVRPNILVIGFGMPRQEQWLHENWGRLDVNVALTGGAVFDYVSGSMRRGPRWMTNHGLEWSARLLIEPRRLWRRYILGNPIFLWRVFKQRLGLLRYE